MQPKTVGRRRQSSELLKEVEHQTEMQEYVDKCLTQSEAHSPDQSVVCSKGGTPEKVRRSEV
ncbi:GL13646 [Drosophila persimilis]|uniref:GL13646 n=1 Tax=Drosophila persimilis TaxID=7234 RepID=B4GPA4_DROPE|nr:GL13646 [Drosophila persimilis]